MKYFIPVIIILTLIFAVIKRVSVYDGFVAGGKEAARLIISLLPFLTAVFLLIEVFQLSGLNNYVSKYLGYVFSFFGIPEELSELIIIRPLSGSGSLCVLENIYAVYGVDSYIARCASCVCSCSEAVFYITSVYFVKTDVQKFRYAIPVAILSSVCGAVIGCAVCRVL